MSKINVFRPVSHCIHMKYTGAKRLPLTPSTISETYAYSVFLQEYSSAQAAVSVQSLSKNNDFGGDA